MALSLPLCAAIFRGTYTAERYAVVKRHIVANFGKLADDYAHAVVDEEPLADLRGRVDFDTG